MADHPLRPATHQCLGEPLPHQLANETQAHPETKGIAPSLSRKTQLRISSLYSVLASLSAGYSKFRGRLPTCYSPVRHFTLELPRFHVRLACVRHAASVRSEPGSNSHVCFLTYPTKVLRPQCSRGQFPKEQPSGDKSTKLMLFVRMLD